MCMLYIAACTTCAYVQSQSCVLWGFLGQLSVPTDGNYLLQIIFNNLSRPNYYTSRLDLPDLEFLLSSHSNLESILLLILWTKRTTWQYMPRGSHSHIYLVVTQDLVNIIADNTFKLSLPVQRLDNFWTNYEITQWFRPVVPLFLPNVAVVSFYCWPLFPMVNTDT